MNLLNMQTHESKSPHTVCLVRIMQLYYEKMKFYMEKALFGLTVIGMKNPNFDVATQAVEFWSSVCEEELDITAEIQEAIEMGEQPERENFNFRKDCVNGGFAGYSYIIVSTG